MFLNLLFRKHIKSQMITNGGKSVSRNLSSQRGVDAFQLKLKSVLYDFQAYPKL